MFPDYQQAILNEYERKKKANALSLRLIYPTPASIRDECVELIKASVKKKDEIILRGFVGGRNDRADYLQAFENCDIDKFRPLINFLKKPTINTAKLNIELLAWLIDFEPRPWQLGAKYPVDTNCDIEENVEPEDDEEVPDSKTEASLFKAGKPLQPNEIAEVPVKKRENKRRNFFAVLGIVLLFGGGYFIWDNNFRGNESCMYWSGDHFKKISCKEKIPYATVIAFDEYRFNNFKKIMRPDTLNYSALGKVWYAQGNKNREFFTADGIHPVNPNLELKRITRYIISKYLLKDSLYVNQ